MRQYGGRWGYMADPKFNPPRKGCPHCEGDVKIWYIGARPHAEGVEHTYECANQHRWVKITP